MSEDGESTDEKHFIIEIAKQGRAACKKCKDKCLQGQLRMAKLVPNPFGEGLSKAWYHIDCIFQVLSNQKPTTKRIEGPNDIDGWDIISTEDQDMILKKLSTCNEQFYKKHNINLPPIKYDTTKNIVKKDSIEGKKSEKSPRKDSKDNLFKQFRKLVADITNNSAYTDKTNSVKKMFTFGSDGNGFKGDIGLWCRLLLPGVVKRVYNLQSKQLVKLFSRIFGTDQEEMLIHLEQGDIGETIQEFFEKSEKQKPLKNSILTVQEVDSFLDKLTQSSTEQYHISLFDSFTRKCTSNDLKMVIRLIKGDLRMGAGAKHVLDGVHPHAYEVYQSSRDINAVISKCFNNKKDNKIIQAEVVVMTPVLPMLAEACKSVEQAMKKCPNGIYSEIKYDGERVQVHKSGSEFSYYSRSLKPVMSHKIEHFKKYIPEAFPHAKDLILDSEILMVDTTTGKPLPFGSLGVHKKTEFKDATVCLFIFDCIYYNGESLVQKPLHYRKKILEENMKEIPNRIMFSEMQEIHNPQDLSKMIIKVLHLGLEGLVLKDKNSLYEPGKRHWLKIKKDYLFYGAIADTADLIVLGAWYGTGKKGGMMSVFLMGCYDPNTKKFCTVTKVHTGHDDKTLERLQSELDMEKISQNVSKIPSWLKCTKTMVPDFVAKDPKKQPVWEIMGAEFTKHDVHTANGISIRFPRVTKIRDDKNWESATDLTELIKLYKISKENTDVALHLKKYESENGNSPETSKILHNNLNITPKKKNKLTKERKDDRDVTNESETEIEESDNEPSPKRKKIDKRVQLSSDIEIVNPLPEYFKGMKALVENEISMKHYDIIRNFIAFGGTVLESEAWEEATHVLHYYNVIKKPTITSPFKARHLSFEWVKDSISKKNVQDFRLYTVQWDPDI